MFLSHVRDERSFCGKMCIAAAGKADPVLVVLVFVNKVCFPCFFGRVENVLFVTVFQDTCVWTDIICNMFSSLSARNLEAFMERAYFQRLPLAIMVGKVWQQQGH
jgi:hypothetical protein